MKPGSKARSITMDLHTRASLLEKAILSALDSLSGADGLQQIITAQLKKDGRGVAAEDNPHLPFILLPVSVCVALGGKAEAAAPAAAAFQFFMTAADILDDVEDQDADSSLYQRCGLPLAVNAATALIFLAEKTLSALTPALPPRDLNRVMAMVNAGYLKACRGQHLDLSLPPGKPLSEKTYLALAGLKSASSIENACAVGAILGRAKRDQVAGLAKFGYYLGMSAQMQNDLQGIQDGRDIRARNVTLPFIYALRQAGAEDRRTLRQYLSDRAQTAASAQSIYRLLSDCGAIHYTLIKAEIFKTLAGEQLDQVKPSLNSTEELEMLLK